MSTRDTPRTDAEIDRENAIEGLGRDRHDDYCEMIAFARGLEAESNRLAIMLADSNAERDEARSLCRDLYEYAAERTPDSRNTCPYTEFGKLRTRLRAMECE